MNYETLKTTILQEKYKVEEKIDEIRFYVKTNDITVTQASELVDLARAHAQAENEIAPDTVTMESMQKMLQAMLEDMESVKTELGNLKAESVAPSETK